VKDALQSFKQRLIGSEETIESTRTNTASKVKTAVQSFKQKLFDWGGLKSNPEEEKDNIEAEADEKSMLKLKLMKQIRGLEK